MPPSPQSYPHDAAASQPRSEPLRTWSIYGASGRKRRAAHTHHGWQLLEALEDARLSVIDLERPGIKEARRVLERADRQALVAHKRERPAQALLELEALLASAQKQGFALVALDCTLGDAGAPRGGAGERARHLAPLERGLHSQRIRRALATKRSQGVRLGRPPSMSPYACERIRRERAAGKSLASIANGLNADRIPTAQGGRRWYPATVRYTLKRMS